MRSIFLALIFTVCLAACKSSSDTVVKNKIVNHSFSNADEITMKHLHWVAKIDFDKKVIDATAEWTFTNEKNVKKLILDSYDLRILQVKVNDKEVAFSKGVLDKLIGSAITIPLTANDSVVKIYYKTSPTATALQWLSPQQTAGKKMPYLFTQCESINARTIIPCMDVPSQRITYTAKLTVPKGMMALMSAENPQKRSADGVYEFNMPIAVPTYLIALAVGDIDFKAIDARSGVYAEPIILQKAHAELTDIPNMISAAEQLAGPYRWQRYDVLIQPPSFPIGGMENPKLTFATPTILAGDKSLVSLIAHELAHSWSGNTVTNSTWEDLWLNEGFTTYFERRIMERITNTTYTDMLWELSYQDMQADLKDLGDTSADTRLKLDLEGRDPEDGFTNIPYEKGAHLLWLMEKTVGRENFDKALIGYFNRFAFVPMNTKMCLDYFDSVLSKTNPDWKTKVNIDTWVFKPGVPANCPRPGVERFTAIDKYIIDFASASTLPALTETSKWSTHEYLQFLRKTDRNIGIEKMKALDTRFNFTTTNNSEIAFEWFMLSLQNNYAIAYPKIEAFLVRVGRKKFVKPLFAKMLNTENKTDEQAKMARVIFDKAKPNYHPETAMAVEGLFDKQGK
jgi:leukotriene-A4 hydrolase